MNGYTCSICATFHPFSLYIKTHIHETLRHTCRVCGSVHSLRDYDIRLITAGNVERPLRSLCSGQPDKGMNQLSMWYGAEVIPPTPGQYECKFRGVSGYIRLQWTGQGWRWYMGASTIVVEVTQLEAWRAYVVV